MRSEYEIAALLAHHEREMASTLAREERAIQAGPADREEARDAASDHSKSEAAAQLLRCVLGLETDADFRYLFPEPS